MIIPQTIRHSCSSFLVTCFVASLFTLIVTEQSEAQPPAQPGTQQTQPEPMPEESGEDTLPKLEEMELPDIDQLLTKPPVDWVILHNDDVIVTEPVFPRPNTLAKMKIAIDKSIQWPRGRTTEEQEEVRKKRAALHYLRIVLPDIKDAPEHQLDMKNVKSIKYHEDLLLERIDELIKEGDLRIAYEALYQLDRSAPTWPGSAERQQGLLLKEANVKMDLGKPESALVFLEDLHGRNQKFPGLTKRIGEVTDLLVTSALKDNDYRKARHFFTRLKNREAGHPIVKKWTTDWNEQTKKLLQQSTELTNSGKHHEAAELVAQAAEIWPYAPGLRARYESVNKRFQTVRAGVIELAGEKSSYFLPTRADRRVNSLTEIPLFGIDHADETPHYHSRFMEEWEPTDLGQKIIFHLRQDRETWESRKILTSSPVLSTLMARLDPSDPLYDERLDTFVDSMTVQSPFQFTLNFSRAPLRPEALFHFPIGTPIQEGSESGENSASTYSQRFELVEQSPNKQVYRRAVPQEDGLNQYQIAEIVEFKYTSHQMALQGLIRGEVSMLPNVQPWDVDALKDHKEFTVEKYSLPVTHVLQLNPKSKLLKSFELRRALSYALDRKRILHEEILQDPDSNLGRLVTGPFPANNYAVSPHVDYPEHDLILGYALTLSAKKAQKVKTLPTLKMICDPDPLVRKAAERMVKEWARIKIPVQLVEATAETPTDWDLVYRTETMREPLTELWPFLTLQSRARVEDLTHLPDWLRRELIELDNAGDWDSAIKILHRLHKYLVNQTEIIPLWEVDEFLVYRKNTIRRPVQKNFQGATRPPMSTYHNLEKWTAEPWYQLNAL